MIESEAAARLVWNYENRTMAALQMNRAGIQVVGITSNTVPREIVRATGFFPVLLTGCDGPTPNADLFMEPVFETRLRHIFDRLLAGDWSFLNLLIIPRTSQHEYKLYLYLCEVSRQGLGFKLPLLYLFDMLHTRSPAIRDYGVTRTRELERRLSELSGRALDRAAIIAAIEESNAVRQAIRKLLDFRRRSHPILSGTDALPLIGASYFMDPLEYSELAGTVALAVAQRQPIKGPHVMLKGSVLDHNRLHKVIESHGAVVVAEDDWWGSRSAGQDVIAGADPIASLFEKYYLDAPSPRVFPPEASDEWFRREVLRDVDGVIFYFSPDDDVLGWDYPRQRAFLQEHGIPNLVVREEVEEKGSPELNESLEVFIAGLQRQRDKS